MKGFYEVVFKNDMIIEDYKDFDDLQSALQQYNNYVNDVHYCVTQGIKEGYEASDLLGPSVILKVLFESNENQIILAYCNVMIIEDEPTVRSVVKYHEMDKALQGWWN